MFELGSVVATVGDYTVVEAIQTFFDGNTEVVGYWVLGPGADSSWVHPTLEAAQAKASDLDHGNKKRSSFRPS